MKILDHIAIYAPIFKERGQILEDALRLIDHLQYEVIDRLRQEIEILEQEKAAFREHYERQPPVLQPIETMPTEKGLRFGAVNFDQIMTLQYDEDTGMYVDIIDGNLWDWSDFQGWFHIPKSEEGTYIV